MYSSYSYVAGVGLTACMRTAHFYILDIKTEETLKEF
jgi:hypothetical protein